MATQAEIQKAFALMRVTYPQPHPMSDEDMRAVLAVWTDVLADVPSDLFGAAVREYVRGGERFMPAPGVLRERACDIGGTSPRSRAIAMWAQLVAYHSEKLPLPKDMLAIEVMIEIGGWEALGTEGKRSWARERFLEEYARRIRDADTLKLAAPLSKQLEASR